MHPQKLTGNLRGLTRKDFAFCMPWRRRFIRLCIHIDTMDMQRSSKQTKKVNLYYDGSLPSRPFILGLGDRLNNVPTPVLS